jgi:hypothetical protein
MSPRHDFNTKSQNIERQIESVNNVYFGESNSETSRNFTKLFTGLKKLEDVLRRK